MTPVPRPSSTTVLALPLLALPFLTLTVACGGDGGGGPTDTGSEGDLQVSVTIDGAPTTGVQVGLFAPGSSAPQATGTTDGEGTVTFPSLEVGSWEVEVVPPAGTEVAGDAGARRSVSVGAGRTTDVLFSLLTTGGGSVVEVTLNPDLTFSPSEITVAPGTTVRWRNASAMFHTVTPQGHGEWSSASLTQVDQVFEHEFGSAGTFPYFCQPHESQGMTGTIIVQ